MKTAYGNGRGPVVVLAEDDVDVRDALASLLVADGFVVEPARDGQELSECLARRARSGRYPALVVTDHQMPGVHALDVLKDLGDAVDHPPVIVITAFAHEIEPRARRFGAKAVFHKPFDYDDFRTAVWHWTRADIDGR